MEIEYIVQIDSEQLREERDICILFFCASLLLAVLISACTGSKGDLIFWGILGSVFWGKRYQYYRQMRRQQKMPDRLQIEEGVLIYCTQGKRAFSLPLAKIDRVLVGADGIGLQMKRAGEPWRLTVLEDSFRLAPFLAESRRLSCDLFFPWFGRSVQAGLDNIVHAEDPRYFPFLQDG